MEKVFLAQPLQELIAVGVSGFGSLKDADTKQFVRCINEEAPPGVLQQLGSYNVAVYCATAGCLKTQPRR